MFLAAVNKEFKLVFRDLHSLLVLFVMPAVFILIMSLALQDQFSEDNEFSFNIYYTNADENEYSNYFLSALSENDLFHFEAVENVTNTSDIGNLLKDDGEAFLNIPNTFLEEFQADSEDIEPVRLWVSPSLDIATRLLIESAIQAALAKTSLNFLFELQFSIDEAEPFEMTENDDVDEGDEIEESFALAGSVETNYLYGLEGASQNPTAVQQNVPAWLIFSMFFVVIPISTTLITEKQQGTLARLRTMNMSMGLFLLAKVLPYLAINQVQLIIMLLLGVYVVPLLGGDSLLIGNHYFSLVIMSLAIGVSAIGYALLVAVIAKTTEQAVSIGGVGNILLGAIGGIMVPKFVMPEYLQKFSSISPMSWGLDGFLDIFLYDSNLSAILTDVFMLLLFGGGMLVLALVIFRRQR